ncbi:hypothetical protein CIK05_06795 [Bdellovibrio sp. qaytius]|nr:hypothetical protein CIK05_06795 [Bdellovibrio sp. qaytius]
MSASQAEISSQLEVSSLNFISSDYATDQEKSFVFVGAEIKSQNAETDIFKINLNGKYASKNSVLSYLNLKEIYFTNHINATSSLHIGRKLQSWSVADEKFNLGSYQTQFRWNPLDIESQGLFGVFYEKNLGSGWNLNLFGTPFFIPDQGPNYEVKDGQFQASNPYFTPPPQNIIFQNVILPIDYNIIKPEVSEVVQQPGFGLKLDYLSESFEASLAGTYKPSNQFAFGYKGILVTNRVRVDIQPKTYYEKLTSLDVATKWKGGKAGLAAIYAEPVNPEYTANYNYPVFAPNTTLVPYIRFEFEPIDIEIAALNIDGGEVTELGPDANPNRQPLTQKYLYTRAYQISAALRSQWGDQLKVLSSLQYREAEKNLLQTLKLKNIFDIQGPWKMTLDVFLVETSDESSTVSNYRNLDQVWAGASYEF